MEFTNDRQLQMQSMQMCARLYLRHQPETVPVRTVVQMRRDLRLRKLTGGARIDRRAVCVYHVT